MDKITKSKRGLEVVASHSSGYKISLEKFLHPKITSANLFQPIQDIINYFTCVCPLDLENLKRKGITKRNYKNLNISRTKRAFSVKLKTSFIAFKGYHLVKKYKIDKKALRNMSVSLKRYWMDLWLLELTLSKWGFR